MLKTVAAAAFVLSFAAAPALAQEAKDGFFTTSDGVKLHYVEIGDKGSPVILLHGFQGDVRGNWFSAGIPQALAKNHRVIALDQRGHGQSEKPHDPAKYAGERMPDDVVELMDHLKIKKAHIGGYSMGGAITTMLMAKVPERFITAEFGGWGVREADEAAAQQAAALDPKGEDPAEAEIRARFTTPNPNRDEAAFKALMDAFQSGGRWAPTVDLTKITFPVIGINGEFDRPHTNTVRMKRELKSFESVVLPGRSHLTAVSHPLYRESLVRFIDAHDEK